MFNDEDDEELEDADTPYMITLNILVILSLITFVMIFEFGVASASWVYTTETTTPKALSIAV